ncbi:MAG: glutaredoxin family protein [Candidatus Andersenbacteria bacterium]
MASDKRVVIYTVTGCPFCKRAKALLNEHKVVFTERDVATNESWADELMTLTGHAAVPVTLIAGETIVGFDKPKLEAAIATLSART